MDSGPLFLPPSLSGTAALDGLRPSRALQHGGLLLPLVPRGPAGSGSPAILPDRRYHALAVPPKKQT
jgi:hypothetical protein